MNEVVTCFEGESHDRVKLFAWVNYFYAYNFS